MGVDQFENSLDSGLDWRVLATIEIRDDEVLKSGRGCMIRKEAIYLRTVQEIELGVVIIKGVKYGPEEVQTLGSLFSITEMVWKAKHFRGE